MIIETNSTELILDQISNGLSVDCSLKFLGQVNGRGIFSIRSRFILRNDSVLGSFSEICRQDPVSGYT